MKFLKQQKNDVTYKKLYLKSKIELGLIKDYNRTKY